MLNNMSFVPYPIDQPTAKHDVILAGSSDIASLPTFSSSSAVLASLQEPISPQTVKLTSIYSYKDAPHPPLSRSLVVLGLVPRSVGLMRKVLVGSDSSCRLASKRGDVTKIPEPDLQEARAWGKLLKQGGSDQVILIATDKFGRLGVLESNSTDSNRGDWCPDDFVATIHVVKLDQIQAWVSGGATAASNVNATEDLEPNSSDDVPRWKPPDEGTAAPRKSVETSGLWQPPCQEEENQPSCEASSGLWQPPSDSATGEDSEWGGWDATASESNGCGANTAAQYTATAPAPTSISGQKRSHPDSSANTFHANAGAAAADAFYSGLTRSLDTRSASRLYHMRAFNGWVKATLISEVQPTSAGKLSVLDLACGKGGDLGKWVLHSRGLHLYVGMDVARGSLQDAALRIRQQKALKNVRCVLTCADLGADVPGRARNKKKKKLQPLLTWSWQDERTAGTTPGGTPQFSMKPGGGVKLDDTFNIVSIQFAIHYLFQTKQRARRYFRTVAELLEVGGVMVATTMDARVVMQHLLGLGINFHNASSLTEDAVITVGGGACRLRFAPKMIQQLFAPDDKNSNETIKDSWFGVEYSFTLQEGDDHSKGVGDAVNLPEWLTPVPALRALAAEVGLELQTVQNFHEFYSSRINDDGATSTLYSMRVLNRHGSLSKEEWEISRLYCSLQFVKVKDVGGEYPYPDEEDENGDNDDEAEVEIDPAIKAKMLPMAMMRAKKEAGGDVWNTLPSEEKTRLTTIMLRKLVSAG